MLKRKSSCGSGRRNWSATRRWIRLGLQVAKILSGVAEGAVEITLDRQVVSQHCPDCDVDFTVVRGSVYDAGEPFGLYLIALHGHSAQGTLGHLAIAMLDRSGDVPHPKA